MYVKKLNSQSVAKRELPKYQTLQFSKFQIDQIKKEISRKVFVTADFPGDKISSFTRIKLSNSQALLSDDKETGISLPDFDQHLRGKNKDVPDNYFTLLYAAGITLVLNLNAKAKERRSWVPPKL